MIKFAILTILSFIAVLAYSQDSIINITSYSAIRKSNLDREELLFRFIKQKKYDYWEFRCVDPIQYINCPPDSIDCLPKIFYKNDVLAHGEYKNINDSIKLSQIGCREGFWWIPPTGGDLYFITIKSNHIDSIINKIDLLEFLKPFDSIDKLELYFDSYGFIKYKKNSDNFDIIAYDTEKPIRYYKNKNGLYNVFEKLYLRIYKDGSMYKKRIGEYHLKRTGSLAIP